MYFTARNTDIFYENVENTEQFESSFAQIFDFLNPPKILGLLSLDFSGFPANPIVGTVFSIG